MGNNYFHYAFNLYMLCKIITTLLNWPIPWTLCWSLCWWRDRVLFSAMAQHCCPVIHTRRVKVRCLMGTSACKRSSMPSRRDVHCVNVLLVSWDTSLKVVMVSRGGGILAFGCSWPVTDVIQLNSVLDSNAVVLYNPELILWSEIGFLCVLSG